MGKDRTIQSILILNIGYRLPVLAYCAIIFIQSSSPAGPGLDLSFPGFDKILHFAGYAVLGVLASRWIRRENPSFDPSKVAVLAAFFCLLYGFSDEVHQSFVAERSCEVLDLLADAAGGTAGAVAFYMLRVKGGRQRKRPGSEQEGER